MDYVDVPQVEMRPLTDASCRFSAGRQTLGVTSAGLNSTDSSPSKFNRNLEEINLQLEEDFQEDRHFMTRRNSEKDQEYVRNEYVVTSHGCVYVEIIGDPKKTPIITYHDIGMNHKSSFSNFFFCSDMMPMADQFCVYHINAPGQEEGAPRLPPDFSFPSMEDLSEQVLNVVEYFHLRRVIGLGSGAGANVLARFAFNHPEHVQALILANPTSGTAGWIEWGYQKMNSRYLKKEGIGNFSFDYLLWHYFGRRSVDRQIELKEEVRENLGNMEPFNLALFIDSYTQRDKLPFNGRSSGFFGLSTGRATLSCQTMLLVGDDSPHLDDVTAMNETLDPTKTSFVKVSDCGGLALEEQPEKSAESMRLFLQGMGYIPLMKSTRLAPSGIVMARCQSAYNLLAKDRSSWQRNSSSLSLRGS